MDSQIFKKQFQGSKLNGLRIYLNHWKDLRTLMSKMGSHDPFRHLKHKLWPKERLGVKLPIWLPTIKSWESPRFPPVQVECDILLKISWQGLKLFFRLHLNLRFARKIMGLQSCGSLSCKNFGTPIWKSRDKMPFGCGLHGEAQSIL